MVETSAPATVSKRGKAPKRVEIKLSPKEQIAAQLKKRVKPIAGIESAWLEDLGQTIYVYVMVNSFRNATLHPIFNAQYEVEAEFMHITFHFDINPIEMECKATYF